MSIGDQIAQLIKEHGGVLERHIKHNVWRFPDGRVFVTAQTPGDVRAERNCLADLRRFLGVKREINKNPERKEKKGAGKPVYKSQQPVAPALNFRAKLKLALNQGEARCGKPCTDANAERSRKPQTTGG